MQSTFFWVKLEEPNGDVFDGTYIWLFSQKRNVISFNELPMLMDNILTISVYSRATLIINTPLISLVKICMKVSQFIFVQERNIIC